MLKAKVLLLFCVILSSCASYKPQTTKAKAKLYETFFVGKEGTQYFIKPLNFENNEKENILFDFTFRCRKEIKGDAITNFTFVGNKNIKQVDSLKISTPKESLTIRDINYLFSKKDKTEFSCRFSYNQKLTETVKLFQSDDWQVILFNENESIKFTSQKSTQKKIKILRNEIFSML